jgi:pimeloyl-ACP methyl ester carboxylesterase
VSYYSRYHCNCEAKPSTWATVDLLLLLTSGPVSKRLIRGKRFTRGRTQPTSLSKLIPASTDAMAATGATATTAATKTQSLFKSLGLKHTTTSTPSGSIVHSYTSDLGASSPILTLIHGYPQSAFEWRYLIPALKDKVSLFVPELPGYGISSPQDANDKRAIGTTLLHALVDVFSSDRTVILGGHDRGARICHRLAVDASHGLGDVVMRQVKVVGVAMLDIVPTLVQWQAFANPAVASGYFHWPLLANVDTAVAMITAFGGGSWAAGANTRIAGSERGRERISADGAVGEVYAPLFDSEEVIRWTSEDYRAGAQEDVAEQEKDQKEGKKIGVPTLVMFSQRNLGRTMDCEKAWREWIGDGVDYEGVAVGDDAGHYLPEEAHEVVGKKLVEFLGKVVKA